MLHKEFWGMLFLAFVAWVFISGTPDERIRNVCRPVGWTGNVVTSLSALVVPTQQTTIQGYFNKFEYGCQFLTWRLFYQDAYNKWLATQPGGKAPVPAASALDKAKSVEPDAPEKREAPKDGASETPADKAAQSEPMKAPLPPGPPVAPAN